MLSVLDSKTVAAADHGVLCRAGELSGELTVEGQPTDPEDCAVAATANQRRERVVTCHGIHFEGISAINAIPRLIVIYISKYESIYYTRCFVSQSTVYPVYVVQLAPMQ